MYGLLYIIGATLAWILIAVTIIHVIMDNRQPAKTMAWALVIFFIPLVGIVFYLFFGINHRRERLVSQRSLDQLTKRSMLSFVEQEDFRVPERHRQLVDLFINQNMALPFKDNQIDIITDGYAYIPELLKDIAEAQHHIHLELYIIEDDALGNLVADALIEKARSGVAVRLIYDDVGCWKVSHRFFNRMRDAGIEVSAFLPVHFPSFTSKANYRDHRKLIVIDGVIGYVGGMNIALRYVKGTGQQPWRDTMWRLTGGAVYALQRAFLIDWYFVDHTLITNRAYYPPLTPVLSPNNCVVQIVTSGPTAHYPEIMQGYVRSILAARRYVYIETPYFLPNEPILFALKTVAVGGVDVRIICPLRSDAPFTDWASRSYLRELHEAGAKIYLYRSGFMHSKMMVSDDTLSTCGSTNLDIRSFENNFEVNAFVYDEGTALRMKKVFLDDQMQSVELNEIPQRISPRFLPRLWESLTRLVSPLL
ncbi:cardiolipin synthase [Prevotellaceae bacterium MN60]|nr:cardiolipin synthase [Prevotellaceae bacterium MN60]